MKEVKVNQLLECIERISDAAHNNPKFSETRLESLRQYTSVLAKYLGSSERQAFWFAILFAINLHRAEIDLDDISSFMKCPILTVFKYIDDFSRLVQLKVLRKAKSDRRRRQVPDRLDSIRFYIPTPIIKSISEGDSKPPKRLRSKLTFYEFLDAYSSLLQERYHELLSQEEFDLEVKNLVEEINHLDFSKIIKGYKLCPIDLSLLLFVCSSFTDFEDADLILFLKTYCSETAEQMTTRREFLHGTNRLQVLKLVDVPQDNFRSDHNIVLTEFAKESFFQQDKELFTQVEQRKSDIILSSEIIPQKLFFNKTEQEQIDQIADILKPDNYQVISSRMKELGLTGGGAIHVLISGAPGTGKTAACKMMSKVSCRGLFKVGIESIKSKWHGESERLTAEIFTKYKRLTDIMNPAPILYLNECDGILSKRLDVHQSITQTLNSVQNLLLEGMENMTNGIMLMTTNMTANIDAAFIRRLLFRLELTQPSQSTRLAILHDKIPWLTDMECITISEQFQFTGAQLENISRKCVLREILSGSKPTFQEVLKYCNEELFVGYTERKRIGF